MSTAGRRQLRALPLLLTVFDWEAENDLRGSNASMATICHGICVSVLPLWCPFPHVYGSHTHARTYFNRVCVSLEAVVTDRFSGRCRMSDIRENNKFKEGLDNVPIKTIVNTQSILLALMKTFVHLHNAHFLSLHWKPIYPNCPFIHINIDQRT